MEKPKATPKDFFLWAGAMVSLWAGVIAFIALIFDYINYGLPNVLAYYSPDPWGSVSYEMASLIVLAPVFLLLMRVIRRNIANDPSRNDIWVRRWALYLTVFAAGATIVIDLITLIMYFLRGEEMTIAFLLKVLVVVLVAGAGFLHFLADLQGYWRTNPKSARYINWGIGALVLIFIVAGFFIIGTPGAARQFRLDEQRTYDLQNIQSQVLYYYQSKQSLPANLSALNDSISGYLAPVDPQTGEAYSYSIVKAPYAFSLCATFAAASRTLQASVSEPARPVPASKGFDHWAHEAGNQCFTRTIDPQLYPPFTTR